jgi:hypothetical protein
MRPNGLSHEWLIPEDPLDESVVTKLIEGLAGTLSNLKTFVWDGLEMPARDIMWLKLRNSYVSSDFFGSLEGPGRVLK